MTERDVIAFALQVRQDLTLQEAIKESASAEEVVALAADHGFTVTAEELAPRGAELSDTELEAAAGGWEKGPHWSVVTCPTALVTCPG